MRQILLLILICTGLSSCDQIWFFSDKIKLGGDGYIYSVDKEPIENVTVVIYHDNEIVDTVYTDSTGFFKGVRYERCVLCPTVKYEFKKSNFETTTLDKADLLRNSDNDRQPIWSDSLVVILTKKK